MKSLWQDVDAAEYQDALGQCVYASRLLGQDPSLVLHGGGNTSVKVTERDLFGSEREVLYVKGSGWDLETIERAGFAPVKLEPLEKLATLSKLSDTQMVNELRCNLTNAGAAPTTPSVETILHAALPHTFVLHTHADAVVTVTNTPSGADFIEQIYGESVVIIPYIMPGFDLARVCKERYDAEKTEKTIGLILLNHGVFSFANTAKESYERMIALVDKAELFLKEKGAWNLGAEEVSSPIQRDVLAHLRRVVSEAARKPLIMTTVNDARSLNFARRDDIETVSQRGPATPDHVLRTKRLPLVGRDVHTYSTGYERYFHRHASAELTMLDAAPRVILDANFGLATIGKAAQDAFIVRDIYQHTIDIIERAERLERYQALSAQDIFEVEYWELEQAKLRKGGAPPVFMGEVALVTGAASGIGKAACQSLLKRGAAVVGLDLNKEVQEVFRSEAFLGMTCDVTDKTRSEEVLNQTVQTFGGLDMLVLNAGIFPGSAEITSLEPKTWQRTFSINLDANFQLLQSAHPLLKLAPNGGRIVAVGSKNVLAPGPGQAAYSASKAALNQLLRVAALEWSKDNVRINSVHPNAVFDTGLWSEETLRSRAQHYGVSVEDYKTNNLLKVAIASCDVGELIAELCGPHFSKTTGAQVPIDGGNERII